MANGLASALEQIEDEMTIAADTHFMMTAAKKKAQGKEIEQGKTAHASATTGQVRTSNLDSTQCNNVNAFAVDPHRKATRPAKTQKLRRTETNGICKSPSPSAEVSNSSHIGFSTPIPQVPSLSPRVNTSSYTPAIPVSKLPAAFIELTKAERDEQQEHIGALQVEVIELRREIGRLRNEVGEHFVNIGKDLKELVSNIGDSLGVLQLFYNIHVIMRSLRPSDKASYVHFFK